MYKRVVAFFSSLSLFGHDPYEFNSHLKFSKSDHQKDKRLKNSPYWRKIRGEREEEYKNRLLTLYRSHNFLRKGSEDLFLREDALRFVDDLAQAGFVIWGVTCWRTVRLLDKTQGIVEDLEFNFGFEEEILYREHPVKESTPEVKKFIAELPERITHVSFDLFVPMMWEWEIFPEKWQTWDREKKEAQGKK